MPSISVTVPDDDHEEIEVVTDLLDADESRVIREALREGLADLRCDHAVEQYRAGEASVNEAARIAGMSVADWLVVAGERGLTTQLTADDLADDADAAREL